MIISSSPAKIMVFGRPGSGKSVFTWQLHKATQIPLYHLDKYFYESHWVERNYQEFLQLQQSFVDKSSWIIDGNCLQSLVMRYARADLVIYFNYPCWLCYLRIFKRLINKNSEIDDRVQGCPEKVTVKFLRYIYSFDTRVAKQIRLLRATYPAVQFIEIVHDQELAILNTNIIKALKALTSIAGTTSHKLP